MKDNKLFYFILKRIFDYFRTSDFNNIIFKTTSDSSLAGREGTKECSRS